MASEHSDYTRGDMVIGEQRSTFGGFMGWMNYGGAAIVVILLFPLFIFAVGMNWLPSLVAAVVVGVIIGLALKFKGGWYAGLIGGAIVTGLICLISPAVLSLAGL